MYARGGESMGKQTPKSGAERLDKLLAGSGLVSRREAKGLVRQGRVTVNGVPPASAEVKCDPEWDEIRLDGQRVSCARFRYLMLNKPAGVLSATRDDSQRTVLDLLPPRLRALELFPVGRLDKDTTGLLLLTNDGDWAHRILAPRSHVPKRYRAELDADLDEADAEAFGNGIMLADGTLCRPALLNQEGPRSAVVTLYEGRYHQVKRMFAARGKTVTRLHRLSIGPLPLDGTLAPGDFRELTAEEAALF